eukprot:1146642-Pelagomonas_calceolata.AAC.2
MSNTTTRVRQPHRVSANKRRLHSTELRNCEDTRPVQQLETAQRQRADLCEDISGKAVMCIVHTYHPSACWWDLL